MPDPVSREEKQKWFDALVERANAISAEKHAAYIGTRQRVLVDGETGREPWNLSARHERRAACPPQGQPGARGQIPIRRHKRRQHLGALRRAGRGIRRRAWQTRRKRPAPLAVSAEQGGPTPLGERDESGLTPLQKQYFEIKSRYRDTLLLFRLGDFYELFDADAVTASRELDLMLTTRDRGKPSAEQMPMCGVPYHSADSYIARLLQKGYKVAVCEQLEDPAPRQGPREARRRARHNARHGDGRGHARLGQAELYLRRLPHEGRGRGGLLRHLDGRVRRGLIPGPGGAAPHGRARLLRPARGAFGRRRAGRRLALRLPRAAARLPCRARGGVRRILRGRGRGGAGLPPV